jgi:hypothetical protein
VCACLRRGFFEAALNLPQDALLANLDMATVCSQGSPPPLAILLANPR